MRAYSRYWGPITLMFIVGALLAVFVFGRAISNGKGADLRGSAIIFPYAMAVFWFTYHYARELTWIVWPLLLLQFPAYAALVVSACGRNRIGYVVSAIVLLHILISTGGYWTYSIYGRL